MTKLRLDDFIHYKFLSNIKHSPNGKFACFVVHEQNLEDNNYESNLWLYDVDKEEYFQLTSLGRESNFIWLANNEEIIFSSLRKEKDKECHAKGKHFTVFFKINIKGGEALEFMRLPYRVLSLEELSLDKYLFEVLYDPKQKDLTYTSCYDEDAGYKLWQEEKDYEVLEEIPYWSNGQGFINGTRRHLYIYDQQKNETKKIIEGSFQIQGLQLNDARTQALVIGNEFLGKANRFNSLHLVDLTSNEVKKVSKEPDFVYSNAFFLNDQEVICTGTDGKRYGNNENPRFYLFDLASGTKKLLTPNFETSIWNSVGSDSRYGGGQTVQFDGQYLYFLTTEKDSSHLNRLDKEGHLEKIIDLKGSIDSYSVRNGSILSIALRDLKLQELYKYEGEKELAITSFNSWVHETKSLSKPEHLTFEAEDGSIIDGWVIKPVAYEEGKKYPAILEIHGGPKTAYGTVFFHEMQFLANHGYFVFFCNPRGSDGKGNSFADIRGKYGTIDYEDLMAFTDLVLKEYPAIDAENLGVAGGSYGGFMTNWIIGHTNRFKAAVSQRSISNWTSMGFTADIGFFFGNDQMASTPWEDPEKFWFHSPLKYADKVQTPTLFIHAREDYRCPLSEGLQMFSALKYHNVESRLCMFRGENHELSRSGKPKHRIRRLQEITGWFDRFLKV